MALREGEDWVTVANVIAASRSILREAEAEMQRVGLRESASRSREYGSFLSNLVSFDTYGDEGNAHGIQVTVQDRTLGHLPVRTVSILLLRTRRGGGLPAG